MAPISKLEHMHGDGLLPYIAIGFSTPRSKGLGTLFSWVIRKLTRSSISHVSIIFRDATLNELMVLEANMLGFRAIPYRAFARKNYVHYLIWPHHALGEGLQAAVAWIGTHYDYAGLIGMSVVLLGRALRRRWRNPFRSGRTQFCSEAVVRVLQASKYPGSETLSPDDCDPQQLLEFLSASV